MVIVATLAILAIPDIADTPVTQVIAVIPVTQVTLVIPGIAGTLVIPGIAVIQGTVVTVAIQV